MPRPLRIYQHVFRFTTPEHGPLTFVRVGYTPCQAKGAAFTALEAHLHQHQLPRQGWFLDKQTDISREVQQMTKGKLTL